MGVGVGVGVGGGGEGMACGFGLGLGWNGGPAGGRKRVKKGRKWGQKCGVGLCRGNGKRSKKVKKESKTDIKKS